MVTETLGWFIALGFFAPLHYLGPLAVLFFTGAEGGERRRLLLRKIVLDCTLVLVLLFPLAAWLSGSRPLAGGLLFLALAALPYLRLYWLRRPSG